MKNPKSVIYLLVGLIVLIIVVIAAALFFFPKEQPKPAVAAVPPTESPLPGTTLPDQFDPVEWTRNPQTTPLETPTPTAAGDQGFTVTLPPETAPVPTTKALPPSPGATFPGDAPAAGPSTPATPATIQSAPVAAAPVVKAPAPKTVKPVVKKVKTTEYWIQVASFKDRYQAENAAKALESQGLKGTLTTATVNGQAVVRVRVGPYTNEAEAGKFLSWLKPVKEFEGSYITKVSASRAP